MLPTKPRKQLQKNKRDFEMEHRVLNLKFFELSNLNQLKNNRGKRKKYGKYKRYLLHNLIFFMPSFNFIIRALLFRCLTNVYRALQKCKLLNCLNCPQKKSFYFWLSSFNFHSISHSCFDAMYIIILLFPHIMIIMNI